MTTLKVEIDKRTANVLVNLFDGIFRTGATMQITIDFDHILHLQDDPGFPGNKEAKLLIKPEKALIEIR